MIKIANNIIGMCATNTYYCFNEETKKGFIIDPAGSPERIIAAVEKYDFVPEGILITHGHFDHILAVEDIKAKYQIQSYAGETEKKVLNDTSMNLTSMVGEPFTMDADVYLKDGEEFELAGYRIRAIETPGHTLGGMCFYIESEDVLFSGDTLFASSVGRTDFPGGSMSQICRSIKEKLFVLPDSTKVYPGHMDTTTIAYEKANNPFVV